MEKAQASADPVESIANHPAFERLVTATNGLPGRDRRLLLAAMLQIELATIGPDERAYMLAMADGKSPDEASLAADAAQQRPMVHHFAESELRAEPIAEFHKRMSAWIREQQQAEPGRRFNNWVVLCAMAVSMNLWIEAAIAHVGERRAGGLDSRVQKSFRMAMADYLRTMIAADPP